LAETTTLNRTTSITLTRAELVALKERIDLTPVFAG